ncbi:PAS domain-containing protein [Terriglobus sp.]|uniref:PAS domain-containing protein n=1 Tax=Terriglobus sp. TaxID=1889013 RepID=UPI003AFFBB10
MDTPVPSRESFADTVMPVDVSQSLAEAVHALADGLLLLDRDYRIVFANAQARRISRIRPQDLHGPTHWELYPATLGTEIERKYRRVMRERVQEEFEVYYEPFDLWLKMRAFPAGDGIAVSYADVSELKRATQKKDEGAQRMRAALEATTDGVFIVDHNWIITFVNAAAKQLVAAVGDVVGRGAFHAFPGLVYPDSPYVKHYFAAMNDGVSATFEGVYGEPLNVEIEVTVQPSDEGIMIFVRDVTQQRRDERAIRASEEKYRVLTELGPQAIWTGAPDGRVTYANQRFLSYLGTFEVTDGPEWLEGFDARDRDRVLQVWMHSVQTGEHYDIEARLIRGSDQASRWWRLQAVPLRDDAGAITLWVGIANDIHDGKVARERLHAERVETEQQRRELQAVYDTAPVGLALFEPKEFRYLQVNERQAEIIGLPRTEILGRRFQEIATTQLVPALFARVAQGEYVRDQTFTTEFHSRPGEQRSFNVNYSPVFGEDGSVRAISAAILEITQLRRAEAALVQSEKLAAVGRLASSISHEINNPLEAVTNLLYLAATDPGLGEDTASYLRLAQDELGRVSQIATQTLRFHRQADSPTAVTAAQLVDPVLNLYAGRLVNSGVHVEAGYSTARKMLCFENDIRQVLNNLIANAIDAMRTGGRLMLRAHDACDLRTGTPGV